MLDIQNVSIVAEKFLVIVQLDILGGSSNGFPMTAGNFRLVLQYVRPIGERPDF